MKVEISASTEAGKVSVVDGGGSWQQWWWGTVGCFQSILIGKRVFSDKFLDQLRINYRFSHRINAPTFTESGFVHFLEKPIKIEMQCTTVYERQIHHS